ncbi:hypothetical protein MSC49_23750 [Methylosinus sp. C49]|uniref:hypothetical protein n=1 Tax=Methylosinus sp. C49 TaxID=2699395 RepID=UPI001366D264|nr:hypothetical protein [Methylosinus sp. C49]BBU62440.1 hypothetical protein MSC49_23750 [Methylosinus sp. C49]
MTRKTIVLGDEFDDGLAARLMENLKTAGAVPLSSEWSLAGSQEIRSLSARIGSRIVEISSETYVGLSISGPADIVDEIAASLAR